MRLPSWRYEEIKQKIARLLRKAGFSRYPLDCFELCEKLGIKVHCYSESPTWIQQLNCLSEDAFCFPKTEDKYFVWEIWYNDSKPQNRIRFSIMHEIGHIWLDHSEHSDLAEVEANYFASYILAPLPLIYVLKLDDINKIAVAFFISSECAGHIMEQYENWLNYGGRYYTDYEKQILSQIEFVGEQNLKILK